MIDDLIAYFEAVKAVDPAYHICNAINIGDIGLCKAFKGKIYRPLFPSLSGRYATGSFYMKNTPEVCGECTFKNTSFSTRLDPDNGKRSYDSFSFDYNNDGICLMFNSEADGYHFLIDGSLKNEGKEFEFKQNEEDPQ